MISHIFDPDIFGYNEFDEDGEEVNEEDKEYNKEVDEILNKFGKDYKF
jgi:hypothetical protein